MAMNDVFGEYAAYMEGASQAESDDRAPATPLDGDPADIAPPIKFEGFSSGRPWYVERPSAYLSRMAAAAGLLLEDEEGGSPLAGILLTPTLSLPCPVPDERFVPAGDDALSYPMIDLPENVESSGDAVIDMLAWILALSDTELMAETPEGDLLCYELEDSFDCDQRLWRDETKEAERLAPRLLAANMARLILFGMMDRAKESEPLRTLFDAWGVPTDGRTTLRWVQDGIVAGEFLRQSHETTFPDSDDHDPFSEFHGFPPYERAVKDLEAGGEASGDATGGEDDAEEGKGL